MAEASTGAADGDGLARAVAEAVADPLIVVARGRIAIANAAARQLLGDWIEGKDVRLAVRQPAAVERLLAETPPGREDVEIVGLGGAERRWTMTVAPCRDGVTVARFVDRSAEYAAEQMRVDFVANASHELRTPLATLLGFLETLRDPAVRQDAETGERFVTIMEAEARRMQVLTDDLLSLSRIEAEKFSPPTDPVDLLALAEESCANCRRLAEQRGTEIRIEARPGVPAVPGDRAELLQMIDNLVGNAIRYGRLGTPVVVTLAGEGGFVHLAVADEGEGIPPEHIPRITQRFYRVDPGRSRALGGTGLGLAIVKHIVERHRGRLEIESEVGRGTVVRVRLPASG